MEENLELVKLEEKKKPTNESIQRSKMCSSGNKTKHKTSQERMQLILMQRSILDFSSKGFT